MNIDDLFPGKYFKAIDVAGGDLLLTIESVKKELIEQQTGEQKPVVRFYGEDRGLVLNITNKNAILASYGQFIESWIGRPVILFPSTTDFGGKLVPCVRVPEAQAPVAPAPQPVALAPAPVAPSPVAQSAVPVAPALQPLDDLPF